jgi:flavin-binding protein dodecin
MLLTFLQGEEMMSYGQGRTYKKVEVIGVSSAGIEAAIQQAVTRAQQSLEKLSWFEVQEVRGHIGDDGKVNEYQVVIKVAFELK